jgi:hypothetical protein
MTRRADPRERFLLAMGDADMISIAVGKAVEDGADIHDVVVLLLDTRDPVAHDLARAILKRSSNLDLETEEARILRREEIPTAIAVLSVRATAALFTETHPGVGGGVHREPRPGRGPCSCRRGWRATLLHLPMARVVKVGVVCRKFWRRRSCPTTAAAKHPPP